MTTPKWQAVQKKGNPGKITQLGGEKKFVTNGLKQGPNIPREGKPSGKKTHWAGSSRQIGSVPPNILPCTWTVVERKSAYSSRRFIPS